MEWSKHVLSPSYRMMSYQWFSGVWYHKSNIVINICHSYMTSTLVRTLILRRNCLFLTQLYARAEVKVCPRKDAVVEMDRKKRGVLGVSTIAEELVTINKVRLCAHLSHTTPFGPLMYGSEA